MTSKLDPKDDGVTHVNVYSKGKTKLGRFLSNFAQAPIVTDDGPFESIEGYWYWLSTQDNHLRDLYGWEAKSYGRFIGGRDWMDDNVFKLKICNAITKKLETYPEFFKLLRASPLPIVHYYVMGGRVIVPKQGRWILKHIDNCRSSATYERISIR
jgi:hypothetical protein